MQLGSLEFTLGVPFYPLHQDARCGYHQQRLVIDKFQILHTIFCIIYYTFPHCVSFESSYSFLIAIYVSLNFYRVRLSVKGLFIILYEGLCKALTFYFLAHAHSSQ